MTAIPRHLILAICLLGSIAAVVLTATSLNSSAGVASITVTPPATVGDPPQAAARTFRAKHVVILVIDGPRWTETWGEPTRQYIPQRATVLAPQGVLCSDFANDGPTYTDAGHAALVTGFYQEINNTGLELPANSIIAERLKAMSASSRQPVGRVASALVETVKNGWGARIRTWECRDQNPVPYHLATPQNRRPHLTYHCARKTLSPVR